jgi:hypothetical protein
VGGDLRMPTDLPGCLRYVDLPGLFLLPLRVGKALSAMLVSLLAQRLVRAAAAATAVFAEPWAAESPAQS